MNNFCMHFLYCNKISQSLPVDKWVPFNGFLIKIFKESVFYCAQPISENAGIQNLRERSQPFFIPNLSHILRESHLTSYPTVLIKFVIQVIFSLILQDYRTEHAITVNRASQLVTNDILPIPPQNYLNYNGHLKNVTVIVGANSYDGVFIAIGQNFILLFEFQI